MTELINKQAEWSEEVKNYDAAAEMYIKVGCGYGWKVLLASCTIPTASNCFQAKKYDRAIAILARNAWWDKLIHVVSPSCVPPLDLSCTADGICFDVFDASRSYPWFIPLVHTPVSYPWFIPLFKLLFKPTLDPHSLGTRC